MGIVNDLVKNTPLPRMVKVRQLFDDYHITNITEAVKNALFREDGIIDTIKPGMNIAITAGSRGIDNIHLIIKTVVDILKELGADPFVIPAMGSHGGATAEGQLEVLRSLGINEDYLKCSIKSSMKVKRIGTTEDGRPVQIDAFAAEADGIIIINRVKPHTSFTGRYESGLMKMMAIGLAKQAGAEVCHQEGYGRIAVNIEKYGRAILKYAKILFGVAIVENAFDKTCDIEAIPKDQIPDREPDILIKAKALMPKILFDKIDVLVIDKIGKNISGLGMDPHITGSFATQYAKGPQRPDKVVVLDLTDETHGNGNGVGVADITTRRLFEKFDFEKTYPNAVTSTLTQAVRIPMIMDNQRLAIQAGIKTAAGFDKQNIRLVRLKDTLHLSEIMISESMLPDAKENPNIVILGPPEEMVFDENGDLF
ncbi:DUF2088 domain-containing protein [Thermoanaerobacteraceae bacterium SP2]|nr:DUF2088 domain-containing protein [Thermoanaerobacteraceae bacterium SP2]